MPSFSNMRDLNLGGLTNLTSLSAVYISSSCTGLEHLNLRSCSVQVKGFGSLGTLQNLLQLNCSNCVDVNDDAVALFLSHRPYPNQLTNLNLSNTSITHVGVNMIGLAMSNLRRVEFSGLNLNDGSCVRTLTRSNRNLLELDLSYTKIQHQSEILCIGEFCANLLTLK